MKFTELMEELPANLRDPVEKLVVQLASELARDIVQTAKDLAFDMRIRSSSLSDAIMVKAVEKVQEETQKQDVSAVPATG
jgi:hypothetical protein